MDSSSAAGLVGGILVLILFTSFIKIFVSLSVLRYGLGLVGGGLGLVVASLALVLALAGAYPVLSAAGVKSFGDIVALISNPSVQRTNQLESAFRPRLKSATDQSVLNKILEVSSKGDLTSEKAGGVGQNARADSLSAASHEPNASAASPGASSHSASEEVAFPYLAAAFLITQLREAFQIGLMFIIPFLVIDLLVANVLLVLGATQISASVISIPLKILIFVAVDGWSLVAIKLIG